MKNHALKLLLSTAATAILIAGQSDVSAKERAGADRASKFLQSVDRRSIDVAVNPRTELFSIIFRLAGNPEYNQNRFELYVNDIEAHFSAYRDHPAVSYARNLRENRGIGFDAVMSIAIHVTDLPDLNERIPFERSNLDKRWDPTEARRFVDLARTFASDSNFQGFLRKHTELYELAATRMQELLSEHIDETWFLEFFGGRPGARFIVDIGLSNGGANYGPSYRSQNASEELHAIVGTWLTDNDGIPIYDERVIPTIVHEFSHSFVNPTVASYKERLRDSGEPIFASVSHQMQNQAYGNWEIMIGESLVRTAVARYILARDGPAASYEELRSQKLRGFLWIDELFSVFGVYENARERYPTFDAFFPVVTAYFDDLSMRVEAEIEEYDASRPQIVSMSPPNGSMDVDPSVERIQFTFERPMVRDSYSVVLVGENGKEHYPEVENVGFDETGMVFTMDVKLKPEWRYEFSLNSESGGAFKSVEGIPLKAYRVQFRTASAEK